MESVPTPHRAFELSLWSTSSVDGISLAAPPGIFPCEITTLGADQADQSDGRKMSLARMGRDRLVSLTGLGYSRPLSSARPGMKAMSPPSQEPKPPLVP